MCNDKSLGVKLVVYPFSRIIIIDFQLVPVICVAIVPRPIIRQSMASIYGTEIKSNQKVVDYFHNVPVTVKPSGMSYQANHYCSSQE